MAICSFYVIGSDATGLGGLEKPVILTFNRQESGAMDETVTHEHPFLEVFYYVQGRGVFEIDGKKYTVESGDLLTVNAGKRHKQYSMPGETATCYCFAVTNVHLSSASRPDALSDEGFSIISDDGELLSRVLECEKELEAGKPWSLSAASAHLKLLLIEIARRIRPRDKAMANTVAGEVKTYIEGHCTENITLDALCHEFYINKSTLLHSFKREFGTSPLRYLNSYRIELSKKFLSDGMSVTEAAMNAGFSNPVYFTETFHKITGLRPSAYKRFSHRSKL